MRIFSWNVNGVRAAWGKGLGAFVKETPFDVLCLQETRAPREAFTFQEAGCHVLWNEAQKKGYSGTAVLSRVEPRNVVYGMGIEKHDNEGRLITVEYKDFYLVNVYTPNSQRGLLRLGYRSKEWDPDFRAHVQNLARRKPVVICGDLNVAHTEIDLANPKTNRKNAGFTEEERHGMGLLLEAGFIDSFRVFNKEGGHYTWWAQFANARARNIGWRIDYVCLSEDLRSRLESAAIHPHVWGSDHCPVEMNLAV